jgi:O-antigen ligase
MTRSVENYNLIYTMRQNPILGQGFGHKYIEKIQAYDVSHHFNAYEYVPHNSILWVLTSGGILFSTFFF